MVFIRGASKRIKMLYSRLEEHEISALGAQIAYYLIFSFFPFLILLMTVMGNSEVSKNAVLQGLKLILPESAFDLVKSNIIILVGAGNFKLMSLGFIAILWVASNGVGAIIRGLNKAYGEQEIRAFWVVKGEAILFTMALAFILLLSFILLIFGEHIGNYFLNLLRLRRIFFIVWDFTRYLFMIFVMGITFTILYYHAPNRKLMLKEVVPGAIFATLGWILSSLAFAYYVNNFSDYSRTYGAIGGIIVLLVWLFISAVIVLVGGELNALFAFEENTRGKHKGTQGDGSAVFKKK